MYSEYRDNTLEFILKLNTYAKRTVLSFYPFPDYLAQIQPNTYTHVCKHIFNNNATNNKISDIKK